MNKIDFFENLIEGKEISEKEIIYFSQNSDNLFEDFKIDNEDLRDKTNDILNILSKYLPCSLPIIEEYLKKIYGYPNNVNSNPELVIHYSILLKNGINNYKRILEELNCDFKQSKFLEEYSNNLALYEKQEKNFKEITELNRLRGEIEKISSENRILENEEVGDLKKILNNLEDILKLNNESNRIIKALRKVR